MDITSGWNFSSRGDCLTWLTLSWTRVPFRQESSWADRNEIGWASSHKCNCNFHFIFAFKIFLQIFFHCGFKYITGSLCLHSHISTKYYPDQGAECFGPFRGSDPFLATRHLFHSKITRIRVCNVGFLVKVLDFCTCLLVNIVTLFLLCLHMEFVVKDKKFLWADHANLHF